MLTMIIIGSPGSPTAGRAARPVAEPDRIVVTVAVDSTSPPTEGRYLNDAELEALYT